MVRQPRWFSGVSLTVVILLQLMMSPLVTALEWQDIASELMSPACPGRTLTNCTSGQSEQWREVIRQKVAEGQSKQDIMAYFVEMRGEEILAAPPKKGFALAAWLLPLFVVLNGAGLILALTFRWVRQQPATITGPETLPDETATTVPAPPDPYRQRLLRELEEQ